MEALVLDTEFMDVDIVDTFESFIWTDRYSAYGDFELYTKASDGILGVLQPRYYLHIKESDRLMIIESRKIENDPENGPHLIFSGRSSESILKRRIIWQQTILTGNLQNGILKLLNENAINPTIAARKIDNLVFEASNDPAITSLTVDAQYTYKELYETIKDLCDANNIGFKITLSDTNKLVFKLYSGIDRSYDQFNNPYVIFSPSFDNLLSGNYSDSSQNLKNVTLVAGEGEGADRVITTVGDATGLDRYEMHTDARDLSKTVDEVVMSDTDYLAQLEQRGLEDLANNISDVTFEGQADPKTMFIYGEDYFLGDVVQFDSGYGISAKSRITEITMSQNTSSIDTYPTFAILE